MKLSSDINFFYGKYSIEKSIDILAEAGFEAIDFSFMDKKYYAGETSDTECKSHYTEIRKYAENKGISIVQAHAPCLPSTDDEEKSEQLFESIAKSVKNASYLGAELIVVHPKDHIDYSSTGGAERLFELNMDYYNRLKPYCEEYGIKIGVENLSQYHKFSDVHSFFGCHRIEKSVCSTPEEFVRYIDSLDNEWFVACLDIGHAMIAGQNPVEIISALGGERLKALHIHDNNGLRDWHTLPYLGGMADWDGITDALRDINYSGNFSFEAGNFFNQFPKELYPECVKFMADIGKHIIKNFED